MVAEGRRYVGDRGISGTIYVVPTEAKAPEDWTEGGMAKDERDWDAATAVASAKASISGGCRCVRSDPSMSDSSPKGCRPLLGGRTGESASGVDIIED